MAASVDGEEQYHLKWNDYNCSLTKCFRDLRENEEMLDVSLVAEGQTFRAHKLVLSACSPVFKSMLKRPSHDQALTQPFVFLHNVRREDIEAILEFMYNGEVSVNQEELQSFLGVAEDLRVRGLTQMEVDSKTDRDGVPTRKRQRSSSIVNEDVPKRYVANDDEEEPVIQEPEFTNNYQDFSARPTLGVPETSNTQIDFKTESQNPVPSGQVSYHRLGGRDADDPLCNVLVTHSDKGWHCPDCVHIATTKGNLKSHILSGRHKVGEKQFKCRFCERNYLTRQSLQVHISTNHRQERNIELQVQESHQSNFYYPGANDQEYSDSSLTS